MIAWCLLSSVTVFCIFTARTKNITDALVAISQKLQKRELFHLSLFLYRAQKLTISLILCTNMTLSTLLIIEVCRTRVVWNSKIWASIPRGESEFFLWPTLVTRRKKKLSHKKRDVIYFVMKSKERNRIFRALMLYRSDTETLIFSGQAHSLGL